MNSNNQNIITLPYQEFIFKQKLHPYESRLFRSAVLRLIRPYYVLYHNHKIDGARRNYPLIQYKSIQGNAAILYLGKGIEGIQALFNDNRNKKIVINEKTINFEIQKIIPRLYHLEILEKFRRYKIQNWLPLQDKNYEQFKNLKTETEKIKFLENILIGNILSFAKGVNWNIKGELKIKNMNLSPMNWVSYKNIKFITYDAYFETNAFLPPHIGLGKGAAHNYGVIYPVKQNKNQEM
jgi:hypothetical protein